MTAHDPWQLPAEWLAQRRAKGLERRHRPFAPSSTSGIAHARNRQWVNFASNDYLGLAHHPAVIAAWQAGAARWGVGSTASALVCGYTEAHETLESALAAWLGFPAARLFTSGYAANLAAVTMLASESPATTAIFADKLVHASLIDALLLARAHGAHVRRYPHRDTETLARWLAESPAPLKIIVTDGVFSMDGDIAPLPELASLAERHRAWLIVDDAHGIGVLGNGRGTFAHFGCTPAAHWLWIATFGKAVGVAGAAILGSKDAIAWLDQSARTHIYTTAMPPAQAEALNAAITVIRNEPDRLAHLHRLIAQWRLLTERLPAAAATPLESATAIQPLIVGESQRAVYLAQALETAGFLVPAIRPPTVPPNTARLRISLSAAHEPEQLANLAEALQKLLALQP